MENKRLRRQLNNAGFTLVEMIVVLVIMVILLSLSVGGIMAWQDWSKMKQLNANAESIFVAAQTQLSDYSASGSLEREVKEALDKSSNAIWITENGGEGSIAISELEDPDGNNYVWKNVWKTGYSQGTIVSVSSNPGDYQAFLDQDESLDKGTALLFKLITAYIYDKAVLNNGSIVMEFSPDAAQVLAVCYSSNSPLSYSEDDGICIKRRREDIRNELALGYYGVATLSMPIKGKTDNTLKIRVKDFVLRNEELLDALYVPDLSEHDIFAVDKAYTFKLSIDDHGSKERLMTLEFTVSGNKPLPTSMKLAQGKNATQMKATYYKGGLDVQLAAGEEAPVFMVPVWMEVTATGDRAIRIALDAADIQAQSVLYDRAMKLSDTGLSDEEAAKAKEAFSKTYSFYRFGLNTDEIELGLVIQNALDPTEVSEEVFSSSHGKTSRGDEAAFVAFGSVERNGSKATYEIANGRHLYNIRFTEDYADKITDVSETPAPGDLKNNIDWGKAYDREYKLTENINWRNFCAYQFRGGTAGENFLFDSYYLCDGEKPGMGYADIETEIEDFPSFKQLSAGSSFSAENGTYISDLTITTDANERYGVYGYDAKELYLKAAKGDTASFDLQEFERAKGQHPTGLFAYNYGEIKGLTLKKHKVFGTYKTGGFVGENLGMLSALKLQNDANTAGSIDKAEESTISRLIALRQVVPFFYGSNSDGTETYHKTAYDTLSDGTVLKAFITDELYKKNTSFVVGIHDVGGIYGYQKYAYGDSAIPLYSNLTNEAYVCGQMYIGGISGRVIAKYDGAKTDRYTVNTITNKMNLKGVTFDTAVNRGRILALPIYNAGEADSSDATLSDVRGAYYLGGICGMASDNVDGEAFSADDADLNFNDCSSYWLYTDEEIKTFISGKSGDMGALSEQMRGWYYGGLVGYARRAAFDNCSNAPADSGAYLIGRYYVGGYCGIAELCAFKSDNTSKTTNNINVIGKTGVGGVAAVIGRAFKTGDDHVADMRVYQCDPQSIGLKLPELAAKPDNRNNRLLNTGLTYAMGNDESDSSKPEYYGLSGGICGWNAEEIDDCSCIMSADSQKQMMALITMAKGNTAYSAACAGGLAGFNCGKINYKNGSSEINAIVYGRTMVGGAAGCVDAAAADNNTKLKTVYNCLLINGAAAAGIEDQASFAGSYILAEEDFAGGICGLLKSGSVLTNADITGDFIVHAYSYAGGFAGCVKAGSTQPNQYAGRVITQNGGLQRVVADGLFAGGFAGAVADQALYDGSDGFSGAVSGVSEVYAKSFAGGFAGAAVLPEVSAYDTHWLVPNDKFITANGNMKVVANEVVAGGYYGYYQVSASDRNHALDVLYSAMDNNNSTADKARSLDGISAQMGVSGIEYTNNIKDSANSGIVNNLKLELDDIIKAGEVAAQYWAGGIFGFVPDAQSIYIDADSKAAVSTSGAELIDEGYTYAGGIIGRVGGRMVLNDCSNTGLISSNSDYYGPLCEVNYGTIQDCAVGYAQYGSGHNGSAAYVGGLCGRNAGRLIGSFSSRKGNGEYDGFDVTGAVYVGGLCGENAAVIELANEFYYVISVESEAYAGGICGINLGSIQHTDASEQARTGYSDRGVALRGLYVGLVAGENRGNISGITIDSTVSVGIEVKDDSGAAGVFAGVNSGTIANCVNEMDLAANKGMAGAFAGLGEIRDGSQTVFSNLENKGNITADGIAAGIVAHIREVDGNTNARIEDCRDYGSVTSGSGQAYGITRGGAAGIYRCFEAGGANSIYAEAAGEEKNYLLYGTITDTTHDGEEATDYSFNRPKTLVSVYKKDNDHILYAIVDDRAYKTGINCGATDVSDFSKPLSQRYDTLVTVYNKLINR
ncbi:MAG: prepilin-type N-terminal cleavage/methylation domain-containing protein [Lachnospiraceae bacterium]|nr:prepilin-type N-terminal cleavage/methylation domain-containing protein [Lachnospiraceae bacterium]